MLLAILYQVHNFPISAIMYIHKTQIICSLAGIGNYQIICVLLSSKKMFQRCIWFSNDLF